MNSVRAPKNSTGMAPYVVRRQMFMKRVWRTLEGTHRRLSNSAGNLPGRTVISAMELVNANKPGGRSSSPKELQLGPLVSFLAADRPRRSSRTPRLRRGHEKLGFTSTEGGVQGQGKGLRRPYSETGRTRVASRLPSSSREKGREVSGPTVPSKGDAFVRRIGQSIARVESRTHGSSEGRRRSVLHGPPEIHSRRNSWNLTSKTNADTDRTANHNGTESTRYTHDNSQGQNIRQDSRCLDRLRLEVLNQKSFAHTTVGQPCDMLPWRLARQYAKTERLLSVDQTDDFWNIWFMGGETKVCYTDCVPFLSRLCYN